jgi:precorrin-2 dehydrogenase/sirohydrochlorin ferrochelatase
VLPIILDHTKVTVGLAGCGEAFERRQIVLSEGGVVPICVPLDATDALASLKLLYIAGSDRAMAVALTRRAKDLGVLVNVEDEPALSDFHVPATLRRGELLLTVSTAGRSPGLVRIIREWLAKNFDPSWANRVDDVGRCRDGWRAQGLTPAAVARKTREFVSKRNWLA